MSYEDIYNSIAIEASMQAVASIMMQFTIKVSKLIANSPQLTRDIFKESMAIKYFDACWM